MAFFKSGESKHRPGLYMRFVNRGADSGAVPSMPVIPNPDPPMETDGLMVSYDGESVVTLYAPGCTVTYDTNGTVTLSGPTVPVTYDGAGNVTIGG